ncbi:hypothetical protein Mpal_2352 [Methanosphaerula palustris E1-9c]|uniref:Uncharacterized protein n=1 Tax=Methanosphaerula palustris (strain ATCC BAA-1556 / DSM 19958 / E1-9c) TaxID=521011 RepID=B8GED4_METPE|nr:hypothetical protein Mpal_2352 [Methanosphaerula palustris E1-9c]
MNVLTEEMKETWKKVTEVFICASGKDARKRIA